MLYKQMAFLKISISNLFIVFFFHCPVLYCLWISIEVQAYSEIMFWYRFTLTEAVICLPHETHTHRHTHTVWFTDYSLTEAYKNTSLSSHPASWHTVSHHKSPCQNHRKASSCLIAWKSVCVFGACWCFNYITADITAVSVQPVLFVWKTVTALKLNAGFGPPVRGCCPPTPIPALPHPGRWYWKRLQWEL